MPAIKERDFRSPVQGILVHANVSQQQRPGAIIKICYATFVTLRSALEAGRAYSRDQNRAGAANRIKLLAAIFRGFSFVFGITAPDPGQDERPFAFLWLGIIAVLTAFGVVLFYAISHLHVA